MRRQLLVVSLITMMLFSVFPVVFVSGTPVKDRTKISEKHIDLTLTPPEAVKVGNYDWLKIPDCSYISTPGHPMLPIKSVVVKLPLNSNITQIVAKIEKVSSKENYFVMPALTPVQADSLESMNVTEPDHTIYGKDELYPNEWYVYRVNNGLDTDTNKRVQYATLYIYPVRYLPTQKKIFLAQNMSFTISYTEPAEEATAQTLLKNLIITSNTLEPYAHQLATYKNSTGMSSRAVNLTWVYKNYGGIDRQEQIRNCIKDFATKYGITYVTIFGDADQVPVRSVFVNDTEAGEPYVPTDLYYSDLDGTWDDNNDGIYGDQRYDNVDGIPDVYVGRIPPSLASYAQTAVDKIIGYQQQFNTSESWTQRVVLAAGTGSGDGFSNPFGIAFPFLKNYTANININKNIVKLYEAYGNLSTGSMASELNKGALFANFAGHGNPGMWLFYWVNAWLGWYNGYGIADVQSLTNGFKLPVVTTMACSTARFDDQDCIGEWFVLQPNGGSIAYFGATRIAWGYPDQWITTGLMGEIDWRIYQNFYEGWTRLGQMWGQTAKEYVQNHIWNYKYASVYDVKTLMEFVLLGDPTIRIYNGPQTLKVPSEYATIQGAVNAAYNGDTIQVAQGTYYENVVVNKSVSLLGTDAKNTIIDGGLNGNVLNLTASKVKVSGFTIRRSGMTWPNDIGIYVSGTSSGNNLSGNIITGNGYGIRLDSSIFTCSNNTIDGNNISNNWNIGIYLSTSSNNSISRNNVTGNYNGITLDFSSKNNVLRNNRMTWNSHNFGCFNNWQLSSYVNDIDTSNTVDGKPVYYWISKSDVTVPLDAGYVALINCTRIAVHNLSLTRNGEGVLLAYTKDSTITKNSMTNNGLGIVIDYSSNNTLSENVVEASIVGIDLTYSSNNSIVMNSLTANSQSGIYTFNSSGNHIYRNNMNNTKQVLTYSSDVNVWDNGYPSGGNYWVDYAGADANNDGIGDTPYLINANNRDRYPLMKPWTSKLFEDGFESSNFNAWTGIAVSSFETGTTVSTLRHHGTYSAVFTSNGGGGTEYAHCYKTLLPSTDLYARGYFYVSQSGIADEGDKFYFILLRGSDNVAYAGWIKSGGVVKWVLVIKNGTSSAWTYSTTSPSLNQWYCVELHWKKDAVNGQGDLWVNGVKTCSISGKNTAFYGDVTTARFGLPAVDYCGPTTVYCDCVRIATTYIDPEPAVTSLSVSPNPFSPNGDGSKDTTTIKAAFNVAVNWNVQIRNSSGTVFRTWTGTGSNLSLVWDGKNSTGFKVPDDAYTVRLSGADLSGVTFTTKSATATVDTNLPTVTGVSVNPSSFNPKTGQNTTLNYTLSESCYVTIRIYNSTGALKRTLLNGVLQTIGLNSVVWDGKDSSNTIVLTGTYTIKIYVVDKAGNKATPYPIIKTVTVL